MPLNLLFIHGTGVRQLSYSDSLARARAKCHLHLTPEAVLEDCYWGDLHGAHLNANGASIPQPQTTRAPGNPLRPEDLEITLWELLYRDPLFECRISTRIPEAPRLFARRPGHPALDRLRRGLDNEQAPNFIAVLEAKDATTPIDATRTRVDAAMHWLADQPEVADLLRSAPADKPNEYAATLARAVVARAIQEESAEFTLVIDASLRDTLVGALTALLAGYPRSFLGALLETTTAPLKGLALYSLSALGAQRREKLMDGVSPIAGDILLYQARGKGLRDFIRERIQATRAEVILAHSLGGVACVDLLIEKPEPSVKLLVTAGSQAPYFYEINALHSLEFDATTPPGGRLPPEFPNWLNLYDRRDFVSFLGSGLFGARVTDVLVNNRQPFPQSHSGYWTNGHTWDAIRTALQGT